MIKEIVQQWEARKHVLREWLSENHPESYERLVEQLVRTVLTGEIKRLDLSYDYAKPLDPDRTVVVDHGDYQGVQVFLLCRGGYQPNAEDYIWFDNYYGSCSGCDTLQAIEGYSGEPPDDEQVRQYMDLALHMIQRMKWLGVDDDE